MSSRAWLLVVIAFLIALPMLVFRAQFGIFPPTRVNLIWWIDPLDPKCENRERTVKAERAPFIGTGVTLNDICLGER